MKNLSLRPALSGQHLLNCSRWFARVAGLCLTLLVAATGHAAGLETKSADNIVWPDNAGAIDVKVLYGAKGDGVTDDTAAIQQALTDHAGEGIIYLPKGIYLISDTLRWTGGQKRNILQGQTKTGTTIKLKDNASGFTNPANPKPMIWTGAAPAQRFRNGIRNLTLNTGTGNAGAIGARFIANNQGGVFDVTITAGGDGSGVIGLDLGYTGEQGPCLIRNLKVVGFDVGISNGTAVDSTTFEFIDLSKQKRLAVDNFGQVVTMRSVLSNNSVPFLSNTSPGLTVLLDSVLNGTGAASTVPAITNKAGLYVRNVQTTGYASAISNEAGTYLNPSTSNVAEWSSHGVLSAFPSPPKSLGLPVKNKPNVTWGTKTSWTNVKNFGPPRIIELVRQSDGQTKLVEDWSVAMQRAIDSGATTIYYGEAEDTSAAGSGGIARDWKPSGRVKTVEFDKSWAANVRTVAAGTIQDSGLFGPMIVRGNVRRIIGCENSIGTLVSSNDELTDYQPEYRPTFIIEDGGPPVVIIERFDTWYSSIRFEQKSSRTLVVSSLSFYDIETDAGSGDVFLDDVRCKKIRVNQSNVWGRQVNPEGVEEPRILNDGGNVWILGLKTEGDATIGLTRGGGKTEILGGFYYANKDYLNPKQWFINENSSISFTGGEWKTTSGRAFDYLAKETRNGQTRTFNGADAPNRAYGHMATLYTGYKSAGTGSVAAIQNFTATAQTGLSVNLNWNAVAGADAYRIEIAEGTGPLKLLNTVASPQNQYLANGLKANKDYTFRLVAFNGSNERSTTVTVRTTAS